MSNAIEIKDNRPWTDNNRLLVDRRIGAFVGSNEVATMSLNSLSGKWSVCRSQCLPSSIDDAESVVDAFTRMFEHYKIIKDLA